MVPEVGLFLLILASISTVLSLGSRLSHAQSLQTRSLRLSAFLVMAAFIILAYSFYRVDLSLQIVYQHADGALPPLYRIGAVWGGHEGSMLLWLTILNGWILAASYMQLPAEIKRNTLTVLSGVNLGFLLFILTVSNPFARYLPITPTMGEDLNPFLQDPVMLIHPPILYMGYLGFVVPYALSFAVLMRGKCDADVLTLTRQCVSVAWSFLTVGIVLGSFWAYYELGWGGWWFWDPVENASLMPWLAGCALLHVIRVAQVRNGFIGWTLLLCIIAFSLAILGTFLVRSGALTSVHSFANDPTRGLFILFLLALYTLPALALFSLKSARLVQGVALKLTSREGLLIVNNVLFMIVLATVILGTLYPLVIESLGLGFISVGAPYFNALVVPIALFLGLVLGFAPYSRYLKRFAWKRHGVVFVSLGFVVIASLIALAAYWFKAVPASVLITLLIAWWIVSQTLISMFDARLKMSLMTWGMHLAHVGFAVFIVGAAVSSTYSTEEDIALKIGQSHTMNHYQFTLNSVTAQEGPNFSSARADLTVQYNDQPITNIYPEKRFYTQRNMPIAEIALQSHHAQDIYVALAEPLSDDQWILRIQIKPLVRLVWMGGLMMAAGAMLAFFGTQKRRAS